MHGKRTEILGHNVSKLVNPTCRVENCKDSESGLGSKIGATQPEHWDDTLFDSIHRSSCTDNSAKMKRKIQEGLCLVNRLSCFIIACYLSATQQEKSGGLMPGATSELLDRLEKLQSKKFKQFN